MFINIPINDLLFNQYDIYLIINVYIDIMNKKIEELTRSEVLLQTRLAIAEKVIASFKSENEALRSENDKSTAKKPAKNK